MQLLGKHILVLGRLFILLFLVVNAGYTVVLYHCTMQYMGCCAASSGEMAGSCGMMDTPKATDGASVSSGEKCVTLEIAGGVKTDPTVVEKSFSHRLFSSDLPNYAVSAQSFVLVDTYNQTHAFTTSTSISPPSVEKYVLASSFLI